MPGPQFILGRPFVTGRHFIPGPHVISGQYGREADASSGLRGGSHLVGGFPVGLGDCEVEVWTGDAQAGASGV